MVIRDSKENGNRQVQSFNENCFTNDVKDNPATVVVTLFGSLKPSASTSDGRDDELGRSRLLDSISLKEQKSKSRRKQSYSMATNEVQTKRN